MLAAVWKGGIGVYVGLNVLFLAVLGIGMAVGAPADPRIVYLLLLFALCSSPVIDIDGLNGRYSLLAIFMGAYFLFYGMEDLTNLFNGISSGGSTGTLTPTEVVILVGGAVLALGYRCAVNLGGPGAPSRRVNDWAMRPTIRVGLMLWVIGILATYYWYFFVVTDKTLQGTAGISRLSEYTTTGLVLAEMLQPVGFLLLVRAWRSTRSKLLFILVMAMLAIQVVFGFVIDIKGMALNGIVLVVVVVVLAEGKLPKAWLLGGTLFTVLAFPVFQTYRAVVTGSDEARTTVLSHLGATLDRVLAAEKSVSSAAVHPQTIFQRLSLKGSVQMIVDGTGNGVAFQHGYTLTPILEAFVPRILWSDKPDIQTGRLVNATFHVSDQLDTYISPSHLGELYWNFGWPGVVFGMLIIGAVLGCVGRLNLRQYPTVTRLLLLVITIDQLVYGFEGALANSYVVWLRSVGAIGLLHVLFARVPMTPGSAAGATDGVGEVRATSPAGQFPNLMT